jgi:hypothetical protein
LSSYHENLAMLNRRFAAEKKPRVGLKDAPDELEDEDLIEIALDTGGQVAWAIRQASPQLKAFWDSVVVAITSGHLAKAREQILTRSFKRLTHVKNAAADMGRKIPVAGGLVPKVRGAPRRGLAPDGRPGLPRIEASQSVRSPRGAVGVMQGMPAPGKN